MSLTPYRSVLSAADVRRLLFLAFFLRVPLFSAGVLLTLHVVNTLHRSWAEAGLVSAVATIAVAISGPWRGRLLDRLGLRRVVLPSLIVTTVCWSIAPFVGYLPLMILAGIAGLFVVPTFSIIRQALIAASKESQRRTVLSLDGMVVELSFMVGPLLAVWLATAFDTRWVLLGVQLTATAVAVVLWMMNPPMRSAAELAGAGERPSPARSVWFRLPFLAVCGAALASTIVLTGSDVAFVAAMKEWSAASLLGVVLLIWGAGSLIGGLVYGALPRSLPPFLLLAALSVFTIPMAFAPNWQVLAALSFFAGLFCAPTITATVDAVSRVVPPAARGEAMGWHGSFMTAGSALGAPIAGVFIDIDGFRGGFLSVAVASLAIALAGLMAISARRHRRTSHVLAA